MRGHETIIAARNAKLKPTAIFIEVDLNPNPPRWYFEDPEVALRIKLHACVHVSMTEPWRRYDFRFVTGCQVHVHGDRWSQDMTDFVERIAAAGAAHVIACCIRDNDDILEFYEGEWHAYAGI